MIATDTTSTLNILPRTSQQLQHGHELRDVKVSYVYAALRPLLGAGGTQRRSLRRQDGTVVHSCSSRRSCWNFSWQNGFIQLYGIGASLQQNVRRSFRTYYIHESSPSVAQEWPLLGSPATRGKTSHFFASHASRPRRLARHGPSPRLSWRLNVRPEARYPASRAFSAGSRMPALVAEG